MVIVMTAPSWSIFVCVDMIGFYTLICRFSFSFQSSLLFLLSTENFNALRTRVCLSWWVHKSRMRYIQTIVWQKKTDRSTTIDNVDMYQSHGKQHPRHGHCPVACSQYCDTNVFTGRANSSSQTLHYMILVAGLMANANTNGTREEVSLSLAPWR